MRITAACALTVALVGCAAPARPLAPPEPSVEQVAQLSTGSTRTLSVKPDFIFPKVIYVLLDNGYVVRSASKDLGFVSIYQQWQDQPGLNVFLEGTVVFSPSGKESTEVRISLTRSLLDNRNTSGALYPTVEQYAPPEVYNKLLDVLERGLTSPSR